MTGEMTLRGLMLPVGGIKDKILAAHRYRIRRVILPERNLKDLVEVPSAVLGSLEILLAKKMEDVLDQAFEGGCQWRQHSKLTMLPFLGMDID
ncbi:lon protease homolog 2, peroxisomal-like isoform X3 [Hevea brasiliensis]|uniref:lon protease homolog 2, peroxisomal-like isoform X3 n=1 Tax=Hevea brasiliensis TaxID=3981 RepID=UPI0025FF82D2|nr:lon protease homolog 2, peroxisomal-like isoform X3 [Hevea brasiliensis]